MNVVVLMGRLTRDPEVRRTEAAEPVTVARYTIAVDRPGKRAEGGQTADFIQCVAFGKNAEFVEKYMRKGMKICVNGAIQTGSYTNKDGVKVYTTDVIVGRNEFCESKRDEAEDRNDSTGFMSIPDGIDEELPFH